MDYHALSLSVAGSLLRAQTAAHPASAAASGGKAGDLPHWSITISREVGALGSAVGAEVGRRLNCPVYDRQILDRIAEEMRRPTFTLEAVDERPVGWLEDALSSLLSDYHVDADAYLRYLIGTVRGLGMAGRCVIVGRGATWILPPARALRLRLIGDRPDRIRNLARRLGVSEQQAVEQLDRIERERHSFARRHFKVDPDDPHHYDLILNVSRLNVGECADVIVPTFHRFETREPAEAPAKPPTVAY
jgi:cytidylate kinase